MIGTQNPKPNQARIKTNASAPRCALALLLCALFALSPLLCLTSCGIRDKKEEKEPDPILTIARGGVSDYVIVTEDEPSELCLQALDTLSTAITESFGVTLPVTSPSEHTDADDPPFFESEDAKVIFFGNVSASHKALERARASLAGGGFSVLCEGNALALFATDDLCLRDLAELFSQKYVRNMKGEVFEIDRSISLLRPFTDISLEGGGEYDLTLPVISIDTENSQPVTSLTRYVNASVSVSNVYSEYSLEQVSAQIRGRGNGTWDTKSSDKLPYRLKFDSKVHLLGIGKSADRDWALLSNPLDSTQLRNTLALTLARRVFTAIPHSSDFAYANLFLSGEYMGVYLICEQAEISDGRIDVEENSGEDSLSEYLIELDYYATKSSNGYLRNVDYFSLWDKYWVIKSDYNNEARCAYVKEKLTLLKNAVESGNEQAVRSMLDMESCVDMYLLHEYTKNTDVGWSSFYMILNEEGVFEFVWPWDFDLSSGNDSRIDGGSFEGLHAGDYQTLEKQSNPIFYNLMRHDFFVQEAAARWAELSDLAHSVVLETVALYGDRYVFDLSADFAYNYSYGSYPSFTEVSSTARRAYLAATERLCSWFEGRKLWLDSFFADCLDT